MKKTKIKKIKKASNRPVKTLCNECSKAIPQLCTWIDMGDLEGREYNIKKVRHHYNNRQKTNKRIVEFTTVIINECKYYEPGPLPPIGIFLKEDWN